MNNLQHGCFETRSQHTTTHHFLEPILIEFGHGEYQTFNMVRDPAIAFLHGQYLVADLRIAHLRHLRDLESVIVQERDVQELTEVLIRIATDVGIRAVRFEQRIALLPYSDGVSLNAAQFLKVLYGIVTH